MLVLVLVLVSWSFAFGSACPSLLERYDSDAALVSGQTLGRHARSVHRRLTRHVTQVVMAFEDEFAVEIPDAEAEKIHTVAAAVEYIASHPQAK